MFVVEYLSNREKAAAELLTLNSYGYVGTVAGTNRELDRLNPYATAIP
ncbi:MAG: hypothetical protein HC841_03770 [Verrucomicrobiae bacterium]|nr:hypothetical protein [Verrucomicrobiae bacterium]